MVMKEWLRTGTMLGPYRVVMRIGVSAIGEVYQVRDEVNFRDCALKLLSATLGWDETSTQRFISLVKSAPQLVHPQISKILDAGTTDNGRPYVVTELVHGRTLDEIGIGLARKLYDKIQIAIQVAEALEAAHQKGILHLGLKPSNVMLDHHGQVRVLDFAVTLATQIAMMSRGPKAPVQRVTIGTARYLSPEQLRGERPTPQSDIFSLGTVIYELFSSQLPFPGRSVEEVTQNILFTDPEPLTLETHEVPPTANPVLMRALAKNPAARYRTASEFAVALRQLAEQEKASSLVKARKLKQEYDEDNKFNLKSLLELLRELLKKWKKKLLAALIFKIAVMAVFLTWKHFRADNNFKLPEEPLPFTKVTTSGKVLDATLAPNGHGLAYLVEQNGRHDLLYKPLQEGHDTLLYSTKDHELTGLTFGWDNEFVYYLKAAPGPSALYKVSIRGGGSQKLLESIASPIAISPNNQLLAFVRHTGPTAQLVIADPKAKTERVLATRQSPAFITASGPAWSHDGKTIACVVKDATRDMILDLIGFDSESGAEQRIASGAWAEIGRLAWLAGDQELLVNGRALPYQQWQIWGVKRASGELRALTLGINDYRGLSLNFNTKRALTVNFARDAGVWLGTNDQANQLISGHDEGLAGLAWRGNDQLVYTSRANKREELWQAPAGTGQAQLLQSFQPAEANASFTPFVSAAGQSLFFAAEQAGQTNLWQGDFANNALKQITDGKLCLFPQLSADGGTLLFSRLESGKATVVRLNPANGEMKVVLNQHAWGGVLSPDGTWVACNYFDETSGLWKVIVLPVAGGPATGTFVLPGNEHRLLRWTPDGNGIAYIVTKRGVANLWQQPVKGGAPLALTQFTKHQLYNFAWSPDGKQLAVARGRVISDAVIIGGWRE
jgi:serine/threonine protein kinase/Tol biopolymer transport system component